jgi:hypothetical protein
MADEPQKFEIVDNPSVGESYANKLIAASFDGGAVVITLGTARFLPGISGKPPKKDSPQPIYVTARLALSPAGAVELANALAAMLKTLGQIQKKTAKPN